MQDEKPVTAANYRVRLECLLGVGEIQLTKLFKGNKIKPN